MHLIFGKKAKQLESEVKQYRDAMDYYRELYNEKVTDVYTMADELAAAATGKYLNKYLDVTVYDEAKTDEPIHKLFLVEHIACKNNGVIMLWSSQVIKVDGKEYTVEDNVKTGNEPCMEAYLSHLNWTAKIITKKEYEKNLAKNKK